MVIKLWLEQANKFAAQLNTRARELEKVEDKKFVEFDMLSMAVFDIATVIRYFDDYCALSEDTRFELKARLERAFKVASRYPSPEAEKVRKAARKVGAKFIGINL